MLSCALFAGSTKTGTKKVFALCLTLRRLLFGNNGSDPPKSFFLKGICVVLFLFGKKRIGILKL